MVVMFGQEVTTHECCLAKAGETSAAASALPDEEAIVQCEPFIRIHSLLGLVSNLSSAEMRALPALVP